MSNKKTGDGEVRFTLRLPFELHAQLKERCERTRRKLNSELIILLERFIDSEEVSIPGVKYAEAIEWAKREKETPPNAKEK